MKLSVSVLPFSIVLLALALLGNLPNIQAEDHHMSMSMENETESSKFIPIPCTSDSQCENETDGLGPLSFCDILDTKVCKCKSDLREIPIRQHHNLCVIPAKLDSACQNDHECGAGTPDATCVKSKTQLSTDSGTCKCEEDLGFTFSKSRNACIQKHLPNPSPHRWWFVLLIVGYPALTITVSATRQRIFKWYRKNYMKKRRRRNSAGGVSVNTTSTDEEDEETDDEVVEMGRIQ